MKNFNWQSLFRLESGSVIMIVVGILLAIKPDLASAAVSAVLGWMLILAGVAALLAGFVGKLGLRPILMGAFLLICGSWLHRNPLMIASIIGTLLGILALSQGMGALRDALCIKRRGGSWVPNGLLAALMLLLGLRLILSPLTVSRLVMTVAGIIMVICGACNLAAHNRALRCIQEDSGIIDADE